jgi:hypothetical protein
MAAATIRERCSSHTYGAHSRSRPCTRPMHLEPQFQQLLQRQSLQRGQLRISSHQGCRCSCTSTRRNICARGGGSTRMGGGTRGGRGRRCSGATEKKEAALPPLLWLRFQGSLSRRPLSLAIPEASSSLYACQPLLSCT